MAKTKKKSESVNDGHPPRRAVCQRSPDGLHKAVVTARSTLHVLRRNAMYYGSPEPGYYGTEHVRCEHCDKKGISGHRQKIEDPDAFMALGEKPSLENLFDRLNRRSR